MRDLSELTGGEFFDDTSPQRFREYLSKLDLHERYLLAFHPASARHDNKRHELEVQLHDVPVRKAWVFWRKTYLDPDPSVVR